MQYFISQIFFTVNKLIGEADYLSIIYLSMFSFRGSDSWENCVASSYVKRRRKAPKGAK